MAVLGTGRNSWWTIRTRMMTMTKLLERRRQVTDGYLIKHGNGMMIAGLDEGLHTMKVGGKRRILIPSKLGYVDTALGPMPEMPWNRWKLNNLLDDMVAVAGGTIIFEVAMLSIVEDEADQGYYSDDSLVVTGGL